MSSGRPLRLLLISLTLCATTARAATLFDPALKFRVLRTEHFRIYFHQGEDRLANRLAVIAEDTWTALEKPLGVRPPRLTHIVVADQTEQPNGYATPFPYDTIVIYPTAPRAAEFDTDDWLRLVVTHEFTHIVHLDRSESWARVLRNVFGRTLVAFPNLFLPTWQIEGLATFEESAITGEGRLHAGDFRVIVDEAARRGVLLPIDRVNGGLTDWPAGQAPYAYGVRFHQYLADRFGSERLADLAAGTARRVPYTSPPVFRRVFGASLGDLWKDFERSLAASADTPALDAGMTRLTHHGFVVGSPRFDAESGGIVYSKRTPDGFPTLERIDVDGGNPDSLATRYFGTTLGLGTSSIYFDQLEIHRNVALVADLYRFDRKDGRVTRLTSGARLRDPDLLDASGVIVAVQESLGQRSLVTIAARADAVPAILASDPDTNFNAPRWSPDGRRIVAERHRLGHDPEIVVIDPEEKSLQVVASVPGTRIVMPTWRPDGRAIVAAAAPDDRVFNLYEFPLDDTGFPRQLTHTSGGTVWPDISPDGTTLVFVGYTPEGYDVFSMPYPTDAETALTFTSNRPSSPRPEATPGSPTSRATPYSPAETLKPTSWSPLVVSDGDQVRIGAATGGIDVLGYHAYAASATWLVSPPQMAPAPRRAAPDWFVTYAYDRWRPTLVAVASSETSFFTGPATDAGTPSAATRRERLVEAGLLLPFIRARHSHSALLTGVYAFDEYTLVDRSLERRRTAVRGAWRSGTAKTYGYSISPEDGVAAGVTSEFVRRSFGASADATMVTADFRAYVRGAGKHHVVAGRVAGGASSGEPTVGRTFLLGGPGPDASVVDFGSGAISLLRGFGANSFAGSHVLLANADYRLPLARPQRGYGTWPLFLHTLHAAAFVDAGHAWTRRFDRRSLKTSIGAELSSDLVAGFYFPFTVAAGVAWGHDGSGIIPSGATGYFRVGKAF